MNMQHCFWIALLLAALLGGCTALTLGYRNADVLLAWHADEYFDLDQDQKREFGARLERLLKWHRYEQLPEYAVFLSTAMDKARPGLKRDDIDWFVNGFEARYRIIVNRGIDDAAEMLAALRPEQISALQKQWDKDNRKFVREFAVGGSPSQLRRARLKRTLNQIDNWTGNLSNEQEERIGRLLDAVPHVSELRHKDRLRRQKEFLEVLKVRDKPAEFKPRLQAFLLNWHDGRDPEYARLADVVHEKRIDFYMAVEKLLTPGQRDAVLRRMQSYADDCRALSQRSANAPMAVLLARAVN